MTMTGNDNRKAADSSAASQSTDSDFLALVLESETKQSQPAPPRSQNDAETLEGLESKVREQLLAITNLETAAAGVNGESLEDVDVEGLIKQMTDSELIADDMEAKLDTILSRLDALMGALGEDADEGDADEPLAGPTQAKDEAEGR